MRISVVVPAYNEERYIRPCIGSLIRQNFEDFEVIVSLNACTDNTEKVVLGIAKKFGVDNVRIVKENRKGVVFARQAGVEAAKGEIIASADADTVYPKEWLRKIVRYFEIDSGKKTNELQPQRHKISQRHKKNDNRIALVYGSVRMKDGPWWLRFLARYIYTLFMRVSRIFGKDNVTGMNFAYRKDLFEKVGGYDIKLKSAEDIYLGQKLKKYGKIIFDAKIFVYTSARRFEKGFWKFLWFHIRNYWNIFILKKAPSDFEDVR